MAVRLVPPSSALPRGQSGFSLLEVMLATAFFGALSLGMLQMQQFQQMVDRGRYAGEKLAALRDGAARYTREHGADIVKRSTDCAAMALSLGAPSSVGTEGARCALQVGTLQVKNAYQPTAEELRQLGYAHLNDTLPFQHGNVIVNGRSGTIATPRWAVSIQCVKHCAASNSAETGVGLGASATPTPTPTPTPTAGAGASVGGSSGAIGSVARQPILSVMLFNTQPFFFQGKPPYGFGAQLKAALQALGPKAVLSLPGETPAAAHTLKGRGQGAPIANPLRGQTPDVGVPGVLGSYELVDLGNPADSALPPPCGSPGGASCRDGSAPPTARWDFNGQDLFNVGKLAVAGNAGVAGTLAATGMTNANGGLIVRHPDGAILTKRRDRDVDRRLGAILDVQGNAVVRRRLVVGGDSDIYFFDPDENGGLWLSGKLHLNDGFVDLSSGQQGGEAFNPRLSGLRLPIRYPGQPCNDQGGNASSSGGNIALYKPITGDVYVMACSSDLVWVKARTG